MRCIYRESNMRVFIRSLCSFGIVLLVLSVALLGCGNFGKPIFESLKAAGCDYEIQYNAAELDVVDQGITLRAVKGLTYFEPAFRRGFGYRSYHIEFSYRGNPIHWKGLERVKYYSKYGVLLGSSSLEQNESRMSLKSGKFSCVAELLCDQFGEYTSTGA